MAVPLGVLIGLLTCAIGLVILERLCFMRQFGRFLKSFPFLTNLQILRKITWRDGLESLLRARTGEPLERPFGTNLRFCDWGQLQFNPVYLTGEPLEEEDPIETGVTLGTRSRKPLHLGIPVVIGGMSYGNALSYRSKIALARATALAETATDSGNGPLLEEERENAGHYILQLPRGYWSKDPAILRQADLIEIGLGHGAWNSAPVRIKGYKVEAELAKRIGAIPGLDLLIESHLPEGRNVAELKRYIRELRRITGGVPIGVKIGATHYIERELERILAAGADLFIFDGTEGGTHGAPTILADDLGLPALPALCRAVQYLEDTGQRQTISLMVGGGLYTPGDALKCLALGADAVMIGTAACLALSHTQVVKTLPWEPPTELLFHGGKQEFKFDPQLGAEHLNKFLQSWILEMKEVARALGKRSLRELTRKDLVALDRLAAAMTGVEYFEPRPKEKQ